MFFFSTSGSHINHGTLCQKSVYTILRGVIFCETCCLGVVYL